MRDGKNAIGFMVGLSANMCLIDRSTIREYQPGYGSGYGAYYSGA
jgi:hypothetical protein